MSRLLLVADLGRRPYEPVLGLQRALVRARLDGTLAEDLLLLVEHEPVVTLGRGTREGSLLLPPAELARRGYEVAEVERGGDVTVHAPGQLVGYPVLDLAAHCPDLHWYLRGLEEALIRALDRLGVAAGRRPGLTGVWVGSRKIASIGVHVKQWVTMHGFALNVTTDLRAFDVVVPCGIDGVVMTSVAGERPTADPATLPGAAREAVTAAFAEVFGHRPAAVAVAEVPGVPAGWNREAVSGVSGP